MDLMQGKRKNSSRLRAAQCNRKLLISMTVSPAFPGKTISGFAWKMRSCCHADKQLFLALSWPRPLALLPFALHQHWHSVHRAKTASVAVTPDASVLDKKQPCHAPNDAVACVAMTECLHAFAGSVDGSRRHDSLPKRGLRLGESHWHAAALPL